MNLMIQNYHFMLPSQVVWTTFSLPPTPKPPLTYVRQYFSGNKQIHNTDKRYTTPTKDTQHRQKIHNNTDKRYTTPTKDAQHRQKIHNTDKQIHNTDKAHTRCAQYSLLRLLYLLLPPPPPPPNPT